MGNPQLTEPRERSGLDTGRRIGHHRNSPVATAPVSSLSKYSPEHVTARRGRAQQVDEAGHLARRAGEVRAVVADDPRPTVECGE
jgi:hypothetical protein